MCPMDEGRFRIDIKDSVMKAQIVAIVRAQHQAVTKQANRIAVRVFRRVDDINFGHVLP